MTVRKIDLNAPAWGPGSQKIEEVAAEEETPVVTTPAATDEPVGTGEEDLGSEESKVPYSRFKKFHDEAVRLREEAAEWRAKAEAVRPTETTVTIDPQDEAFQLWLENFGDSDASRKAWQNQLKINSTLEARALERAREQALEAVRNERYEEAARTEKNVDKLDNSFEDLTAFVGRDLTEKEQSAILDIVDDYTPKDSDGNYLGELIPFDKAWEIYELKQQAGKAPRVAARNGVAGLSGSQTQGEPSVNTEKDKNFNPLDWNAWQKRI